MSEKKRKSRKSNSFEEWMDAYVISDDRLRLCWKDAWGCYRFFCQDRPDKLSAKAFAKAMEEEFDSRSSVPWMDRYTEQVGLQFPSRPSPTHTYVLSPAAQRLKDQLKREWKSRTTSISTSSSSSSTNSKKQPVDLASISVPSYSDDQSDSHLQLLKYVLELMASQEGKREIKRGFDRSDAIERFRVEKKAADGSLSPEWGVRATQPIDTGEIIGPYAMLICHKEETKWMLRPGEQNAFGKYSIKLSDEHQLYGSAFDYRGVDYGNICAFINDYRSNPYDTKSTREEKKAERARINCAIETITYEGWSYCIVRAKAPLRPGDELVVDYGPYYFHRVDPTGNKTLFSDDSQNPVARGDEEEGKEEKVEKKTSVVTSRSRPKVKKEEPREEQEEQKEEGEEEEKEMDKKPSATVRLRELRKYYQMIRDILYRMVAENDHKALMEISSRLVPVRDVILATSFCLPATQADVEKNRYTCERKLIYWWKVYIRTHSNPREKRTTFDQYTWTNKRIDFAPAWITLKLVIEFGTALKRSDGIDVRTWLKTHLASIPEPTASSSATWVAHKPRVMSPVENEGESRLVSTLGSRKETTSLVSSSRKRTREWVSEKEEKRSESSSETAIVVPASSDIAVASPAATGLDPSRYVSEREIQVAVKASIWLDPADRRYLAWQHLYHSTAIAKDEEKSMEMLTHQLETVAKREAAIRDKEYEMYKQRMEIARLKNEFEIESLTQKIAETKKTNGAVDDKDNASVLKRQRLSLSSVSPPL